MKMFFADRHCLKILPDSLRLAQYRPADNFFFSFG